MGFRALLSGQHPKVKSTTKNQRAATIMAHDSSLGNRIASCLWQVLLMLPRDNNKTESVSIPVSPVAPAHQYRFQSPTLEPEPTFTSSSTSRPTTADSGLSPTSSTDTTPTTIESVTPHIKATEARSAKPQLEAEYESALKELHNAEKILEQRHAAIKTPFKSAPAPKGITLEVIFKKNESNPKADGRTSLPPKAPASSHQKRDQPATAKAACDALQRRQLTKQLAYRAISGCDDAIIAFEELNAHYRLKARHPGTNDIPDLILNFEGVHVFASQLRTVERTWLSRVNAASKLQLLADRKLLGREDHEQILLQLFPETIKDLLNPEYFQIFMTGLGTEGILTASEAKSIICLGMTHEEFAAGAHWTGVLRSSHTNARYDPSVLRIFTIPHQSHHNATNLSAHPSTAPQADLSHHLRILIEAAVYEQIFWKGYFFPNARSLLHSFYQACSVTQPGLPPHPKSTEYKRAWKHDETRHLQRGELTCHLLSSFASGTLTDYGVLRAVRGSLIRLPGQPHWDAQHLSTYLYSRVVDSGLPVSLIPQILALHPGNDKVFANATLRTQVVKELGDQEETFRKEEEQRLREIEMSVSTFESLKKKEMGRWERIKFKALGWRARKEVAVPFDPFAE